MAGPHVAQVACAGLRPVLTKSSAFKTIWNSTATSAVLIDMKRRTIGGFSVALSLFGFGATSLNAGVVPPPLQDVIKGYRIWHKVNPKPIHMAPIISMLCRG